MVKSSKKFTRKTLGPRLNWLRAGVLGANDGIVSIAGLVVGVAGATTDVNIIFLSGMAGVVAGAISMAAGEYVSVSSQRDTEKALLVHERKELDESPEKELMELKQLYKDQGLSEKTATLAAKELTERDVLAAHTTMELGITPGQLTNPWHAAIASAGSFLVGAAIPMVAILAFPSAIRIPATFGSVVFALVITGVLSAVVGGARPGRATVRVVFGGMLAMIVTFFVGKLFGVSV